MDTVNLVSKPAGSPGTEAFIQVTPVDDDGNPVPIDGGITYGKTGSGFEIEPDVGDYKVCKVIANDGNTETCFGTVTYSYDADRDDAEGRLREGAVPVVVVPREAAGETVSVTYPPV